jgi:hypothetical protein
MSGISSNFIHTLNNSISAIRKKRYDLVTIFGNRILSDLVILENSIPSTTNSFLSFIGLFLRRVGIDLLTLSQNSRDTAKLKQRAITSISKMREILSTNTVPVFSKVLDEYQGYIEAWANEVNENDLSEYSRNGELDEIIFQWALETLKNVSENQILSNAYPISAIDNELSRMSYVEKLSARTIILSISLRGLEWFSETTYQVINMLRTSSIDKDLSLALSAELSKQLVEFSHKVVTAFDGWKDMDSKGVNEKFVENILALDSKILLSWRKLLNNYYQFQTGFTSLPKIKPNEEKESEVEEDDKSILT